MDTTDYSNTVKFISKDKYVTKYIPKEENIFKKAVREDRKIIMDDEWIDDSPVGRELL